MTISLHQSFIFASVTYN